MVMQTTCESLNQMRVEFEQSRCDAANIKTGCRSRIVDNAIRRPRWDHDHIARRESVDYIANMEFSPALPHIHNFDKLVSSPFHGKARTVVALENQNAPTGKVFA